MALIVCPDCSNEISELSAACIHCGRPMGREPTVLKPTPLAAAVEISCPKCGSPNVQRLSMVRATGTGTISGHIRTVGVAIGAGGLGVGGASSTVSALTQSDLAKLAEPPREKGIGRDKQFFAMVATWLVVFFGLLGLAALLSTPPDPTGLFFFCWLIASAVAIGVAKSTGVDNPENVVWNATEYPKAKAKWERSFLCHRCGEVFERDSAVPTGGGSPRPNGF